MANPNATPYQLIEQQALKSVEDNALELGFRIPHLRVKETKGGLFSRISAKPSSASSATAATAGATATSSANSSLIKVFAHKPIPHNQDFAALPPDSYEEIYQSEVQTGSSPLFSTLLVLSIDTTDVTTTVPMRFETWVGLRRSTPDTKHSAYVCSVGHLVKSLGGPGAPSCWTKVDDELEVRVARPDRLLAVSLPPPSSSSSQSSSIIKRPSPEWRLAPSLERSLLRGVINAPVSRSFQASLSDSTTDLIEFREEMAEMPLNLLIPCQFVDEAEKNLEMVLSRLPKIWSNDKEKVLKLLLQGSKGTYEMTPKDEEALRRYDRAAAEAAARTRERCVDMRRVQAFYGEQYDRLVLGRSGQVAGRVKSSSASTRASQQPDAAERLSEVRATSDGGTEYTLPLPEFPPGSSDSARDLVKLDSEPDEEEEDLSEERQWAMNRATLAQQVSFRPSTSRKDQQLRFLPINLHLQVLTVREAPMRPKPPPPQQQPRKTMVAKARASIAQMLHVPPPEPRSPRRAAEESQLVSPRGELEVPPLEPPAEQGLLAAPNGRRRGRLSIMGSLTGGPESPGPRAATAGTLPGIGEDEAAAAALAAGPLDGDAVHIYYETLSVGAPSAHGMSGKLGGLWSIRDELQKLRHEAERLKDEPAHTGVSLATRLDAYRKYHEMRLVFSERMDIVLCQALTSVVTSIVARLYVMAATGGLEDEDDQAMQLLANGFLIGWESLLSTHGSEINMLADVKFAVKYITDNVVVRLQLLPDDLEVLDVKLLKSNRPCPSYLSPGGLEDATALVVCLRLPDKLVEELPPRLRSYVEDSTQLDVGDGPVDFDECKQRGVPLIGITCLLFTQGINEMQSLANLWGSAGSWQEDINRDSSEMIYQYISKRFGGEDPDKRTPLQEKSRQHTLMGLVKLRHAIRNQVNVEKNYEILTTSADLVRWLNGIRICSCKSAKDRTAMSLTLEEARLLSDLHHVVGPSLDLANVLREHGTRLINVYKNTTVPKYAFNMAQRKLLPEQYRPPPSVIGGFFRGNQS